MEALSRIMTKVKNSQDLSHTNHNLQGQTLQKTLYKCETCKDTGWIIKQSRTSQPTMSRCKCVEIELIKKQWKKAGINPDLASQNFTNFNDWNESSKLAKSIAIEYLRRFKNIKNNRKNSIMFCGQVGSGKTHLSIALALNFLKKNINVIYMPYRDVITSLKQNILDKEFYKNQLSKYQTTEILLIDDLFKGRINETDINIMFEIINYRYLNNLPIIISSEFIVAEMLNFDESIGSRIYEMCKDFIVEIDKDFKNNYRLS